MIRKKLAVLMLAGVTCLASGCGNVVKDGTEALGEGRYDAAETAFEEATKNENKEVAADGYQGLGMTYYEQKEYDKALEAFQAGKQIEGNSLMQTLSFNEIVAYEYLQDYQKAAVLLKAYLQNYPDDQTAIREQQFLSTR